jgi:hypothetical protein
MFQFSENHGLQLIYTLIHGTFEQHASFADVAEREQQKLSQLTNA